MAMEYDGGGVAEWEVGLPSSDDLTPLCHQLIPPELASAFSISPEPYRSSADVDRASQNTISAIRGPPSSSESNGPDLFKTRPIDHHHESLDPFKPQQIDDEETDAADDVAKAAALKRPRLVWTPQLHKRFVDVVAHLGLKNAVPKTIMQMMNVEGLTRENVASHLQKYRLYLKRMCHDEGPSESESVGGGSGQVAMPVMMQVPMVPGHGGYPWMQQQQREALGSVGSFRHHHHRRRHAGSNDE